MFNRPSNKSDLRSYHGRLASLRRSHAVRKSIKHKLGPQNHNHGPIAVIHSRPTSRLTCNALRSMATDPRPRLDRLELPVWLGKSVHEMKISRVTCDQFTIVPNDIRSHRVIYDRPATKGGSSCEFGHSQVKLTSSATVFDG